MRSGLDNIDQPRDVDREASAWLVRLDDEPENASLRAEFDAWLAVDPMHDVAWRETMRVSEMIAATRPSIQASNVVPLKQGPGRRRPWLTRWQGIGATAMAACLTWVVAPDLVLRLRADEIAGTGEVRAVQLADGSEAYLGPGAAMAFEMDGRQRTFRLLRGNAFFDVARDTKRPFKVLAGAGEVTVLGTAFEVALSDDGALVAVKRGLVEAANLEGAPPVRTQLRPGQTIQFHWDGPSQRRDIRPDRVAAWIKGKAIVNDRPLGEVIDALRPWYKGFIIADGTGLDRRRVTGIYDLRNPDAALVALAKAHDLTIREVSPWLRIVTVN